MTTQILTAAGIGNGPTVALVPDTNWSAYSATRSALNEHLLSVSGGFGGSSVTLEYTPNVGITWIPFSGLVFTALGTALVKIPFGAMLRGVVTGGIAPAVDLWLD